MKPIKGLRRDYKPLEQPEQSYPFGKNGTWNANTQACQNEKGFRISSAKIPYTVIGIVETDSDPIIFSTNGIYSAIGLYNEETDSYVAKVDDQYLSYKLGFQLDKYIIGEARRNYKNNLEVVWLDKANSIRFADLDSLPTDLIGYTLFPEFSDPIIGIEVVNGGSLPLGSYYVAVKYLSDDGTETRYMTPSTPVFASSGSPSFAALPGLSTGKSLKITLTKLDTRYNSVQVAIIKKVKGITTATELTRFPISEGMVITYTGTEGDDITLEEILIPPAFYSNAAAITQLDDSLHLADIKEKSVYNLQKYALLVKIKWKSELRTNLETDTDVQSGKIKTFKHGEVYSWFIAYKLVTGQWTQGFTIPGIAPSASDLAVAAEASTENLPNAKNYQIKATGFTELDYTNRTGRTGVWVNADEKYPNLPEFDASALGGEDLRGKQVRHHRMPTSNQTLNWFYGNESSYGTRSLDALGVTAENIIIPPELKGIVVGYEIFYGKRDYSNATVLSSGVSIFPAKSGYTGNELYFTGGNHNQRMNRSSHTAGSRENPRQLNITTEAFKIHHGDMMINRPAIIPSFVNINYRIRANSFDIKISDDEQNTGVDYYGRGSIVNKNFHLRGIKDTGYLLNNGSKGNIKNNKSEDAFVATFVTNTGLPLAVDLGWHGGRHTEGTPYSPKWEETYLLDLMVLKSNIYLPFADQDLVRTGVIQSMDFTKPRQYCFSGDCFLVLHTFTSYGLSNSVDRYYSNPGRVDGLQGSDEDTYTNEFYAGTSGVKIVRRYAAESSINLWQRYVDPALPESQFWPAKDTSYVNGMDRNKNNNIFSVSQESSSIGDLLNGITVYDYQQVNIESSPYKVIRSQKQSREGKPNSWKNFNSLDYYETEKIWGPIINLAVYNDRLIIHFRNALYITEGRTTFKGDILEVTLGTGDIFRMPPKAAKASRKGYAGTQHQLACVVTDFGYVFCDAETGIWFVLNEGGLQEINSDMYNFFEEYLNIKEINPYIGNGITVGYDIRLKRLLVTIKNEYQSDPNFVPGYEETEAFFNSLVPNQSVVFKDGRYLLFKGENTSPYSCAVIPSPELLDYVFTIQEDREVGFLVGTISASAGTGPYTYIITGGNTNNAFLIDADGKVLVANKQAQDHQVNPSFILTVKVIDINGKEDIGTVSINLEPIEKAPVMGNYNVTVDEGIPVDTLIATVQAIDPKGLPLTYSIITQSVTGAAKIGATSGAIRVNDPSKFDYETVQLITLTVRASNGSKYVDAQVLINIENVNEPLQVTNSIFNILDTQTGEIGEFVQPVDPEGNNITIEIISQSGDDFDVNVTTRKITVKPYALLNPAVRPYRITLRASNDSPVPLSLEFTVDINVYYDPAALTLEPHDWACVKNAENVNTGYKKYTTARVRSSITGQYVHTYSNVPGQKFQEGTIGEVLLPTFADVLSSSCPTPKYIWGKIFREQYENSNTSTFALHVLRTYEGTSPLTPPVVLIPIAYSSNNIGVYYNVAGSVTNWNISMNNETFKIVNSPNNKSNKAPKMLVYSGFYTICGFQGQGDTEWKLLQTINS